MVDQNEAKTFVRLHGRRLKSKLSSFHATTLDSKLARTFTDDIDLSHGFSPRLRTTHRPGQNDDENRCAIGRMLPT